MGPPPNNCVHRLRSTLLPPAGGSHFFERGLALSFELDGALSRVERARALLKRAGFSDALAARDHFPLPAGRWLCRSVAENQAGNDKAGGLVGLSGGMMSSSDGRCRPATITALHAAVLLGLCGPAFYAADRPLIWSEARLARRLVLFRPAGFNDDCP